jgi:hypothetical protein
LVLLQCGFKIRALIFPVGPKFENLAIDGLKLPQNPWNNSKIDQINDWTFLCDQEQL